jgi:GNAT superfamily N-acetyltransferase
MAAYRSWLLTDPSLHHDSTPFELKGQPGPWSIRQRTLTGGRRTGVQVLEVDNGALSLTILPTRGMGIWKGRYRDLELGWQAPILGPVHPSWVNLADRGGLGWLDGFDEWVVRCGLNSFGPPGLDPVTNQQLPLHGRIANLPAHRLELRIEEEPPYTLQIVGTVREATMFLSGLELTTTITTWPLASTFEITDTITNLLSRPSEAQLLYHVNFGPPLLEAGARVHVPVAEVAPRDAAAAAGIADWPALRGPTPGFAEEVFYLDVLPDARGQGRALLANARANAGVLMRWPLASLPCFSFWKNSLPLAEGYVTGLEPGTSFPNFKAKEREHGRVLVLPPGGRHVMRLAMDILADVNAVDDAIRKIDDLQRDRPAVVRSEPNAMPQIRCAPVSEPD